MPDMRLSVCCGRAVIKNIRAVSLMFFYRLLENIFFFPEVLDFSLPFHKIHIAIYFFKHDVLLRFPLSPYYNNS